MNAEGYQLGLTRNRVGAPRVRISPDGRAVIAVLTADGERPCKIALDREAEAYVRSKLRPLPAAANPSGIAMPAGDLPGWRMTFSDDFNKAVPLGQFPAAVSDKWNAYPYPWRDSEKDGLYYPEKVVSIHDGVMDLWLHSETVDGKRQPLCSVPVPRPSGDAWGRGQTSVRIEVRFKSDPVPGYKVAWLLWPDSERWPADGEIDFPEGDLDSTMYGFMHHQGGASGSDQYWSIFGKTFTDWHTAVIEWEAGKRCAFYLDGQLASNADGGKSEWTTKVPSTPMHFVLQTETCIGRPTPLDAQGHLLIDWIAMWTRI